MGYGTVREYFQPLAIVSGLFIDKLSLSYYSNSIHNMDSLPCDFCVEGYAMLSTKGDNCVDITSAKISCSKELPDSTSTALFPG